MFGKKKKDEFNEKVRQAKYMRIFQSLEDILKTDIKSQTANGEEVVDYMATCSAIKTKARLAIDFVSDLDKGCDDKK